MHYTTARISPSNIDDFIFIYEHTHGRKADRDYFLKKFDTSYCGTAYVGFIAYSETNEPSAFYGVFPQSLTIDGKEIPAAQSGDTITHPSHRRRGLFERLFSETVDLCVQLGIQVIFGFPNANSYPGFIKFGWLHPADTINYYRLEPMSFLARAHRRLWPESFYKEQQKKILTAARGGLKPKEPGPMLVNPQNSVAVTRVNGYLEYKQRLGALSIQLKSGEAIIKYEPNLVELGEICGKNLSETFRELLAFLHACNIQNIQVNASEHFDMQNFPDIQKFQKRKTGALIIYPVNKSLSADWEKLQYTGLDYDTF